MLKLEIARNAQQNEWSYPFYYNLLTGEITDYLEGVVIQGTSLAEMLQLSIGRTTPEGELYVSSNKKIFKINLETRESVSLNELTGEESIQSFQILEDGYFLVVSDGDDQEGVYFKTASGEKESVFAGLKQKDGEEKHSTFIRLAGDEAVLIKEDGKLYCKNHKTDKNGRLMDGKRIPVFWEIR